MAKKTTTVKKTATVNKTQCRKRIGRKIQPKRFESLEISCEYEDEIEWKTPAERQKLLDQLTEKALEDYEKSFNAICEQLGVEDKPVSVSHKLDDGSERTGAAKSESVKEEPKVEESEPKSSLAPTGEDIDDWFDGV